MSVFDSTFVDMTEENQASSIKSQMYTDILFIVLGNIISLKQNIFCRETRDSSSRQFPTPRLVLHGRHVALGFPR